MIPVAVRGQPAADVGPRPAARETCRMPSLAR